MEIYIKNIFQLRQAGHVVVKLHKKFTKPGWVIYNQVARKKKPQK